MIDREALSALVGVPRAQSGEIEELISDFATRIRSKRDMPILHRPFTSEQHEAAPPEEPSRRVERRLAPELVNHAGLIIDGAITRALAQIKHFGRTATAGCIRTTLTSVIQENCASVITAAKAQAKMLKADIRHKDKIRTDRAQARKRLSEELKSGRKKLHQLRKTILDQEGDIDRVVRDRIQSAKTLYSNNLAFAQENYRDIPPPSIAPHREGAGLPSSSGIYFLWQDDAVAYVGQSIRLNERVRLGSHHALKASHSISYLEVDAHFLTFAECYYIGVLRPISNFGNSASHRRYPMPKECPPAPENECGKDALSI